MPDSTTVLIGLSQIALGFAGFSGVVGAFSRGADGKLTADERFRLKGMVLQSLAVLFLSLSPLGLLSLGFNEEQSWAATSALIAGWIVGSDAWVLVQVRRFRPSVRSTLSMVVAWLLLAVDLAVVVALVLNVIGESRFGVLLAGLLWALFEAAVFYLRLLRLTDEGNV